MIVADQWRADCLGYLNKYPVCTPNLDRLKEEGISFSNAFTPLPTCCPARQAMMTGQRPERLGCLWNYDLGSKIPSIDPSVMTYSKLLKEANYRTAYIGKWHGSKNFTPTDFGYDTYVPDSGYVAYLKSLNLSMPKTDWIKGFGGGKCEIPLECSRTHWQAEQAISVLREWAKGEGNWHLRLDFNEPHLPCYPSEPYASMYSPDEMIEWEGFRERFENKPYMQRQQLKNWGAENMTWQDWAKTVALYFGWITQTDDAIGRLLKALKELGLEKDTVVVFTADHGDMCGSHGMPDKHYVLYDDIVRVPLIVKGYGSGERSEYVMNFDLCPTIMNWGGITDLPPMDARSLAPCLENTEHEERHCAVSTFNGQQFGLYSIRMYRDDSYKYIFNTADVDELYDLKKDPGELVNLAVKQEYETVVRIYRKKLFEELTRFDDLVNNLWLRRQLNEFV